MYSLSHNMALVMEMSYDLVLYSDSLLLQKFYGTDIGMSSSKNEIEYRKKIQLCFYKIGTQSAV